MPCSSAWRGESKDTWVPSTSYVPELGWCSPEMILIRVDLPAPLSPSTQVTSPARTSIEMSFSAMTLPKYLLTWRTSSNGALFWFITSSTPRGRRAASHQCVHADRDEQDHAKEREVPVGVPPGEDDANLREADYQRADRCADRGPIPAGQQTAADDRGDDEEEFLADALARLDALEAQRDH